LGIVDIRHLRTFAVVAEHGTVSKASTLLGVAQPALSRQIKDLETELDVKLFDRIRRRLVLTNEGQLLLGDCRSILGAVHSLKERALLLRRPDAGVLKVESLQHRCRQTGVASASAFEHQFRRPRRI
jgi:LysR family transcriptional regulator, nitrogen assimilation regulatory protein